MTQVPTWLVYVVPTVAVLSLIVAISSYGVASSSYKIAAATYERAGPKVTAWFFPELHRDGSELRVDVVVVLRNQGLASVEIESMTITSATLFKGSARVDLSREKWAELLEGSPAPVTISGNSGLRLKYQLKQVAVFRRGKLRRESEPFEIYERMRRGLLIVALGNGVNVTYSRFLGYYSMGGGRSFRELGRLWSPGPYSPLDEPDNGAQEK